MYSFIQREDKKKSKSENATDHRDPYSLQELEPLRRKSPHPPGNQPKETSHERYMRRLNESVQRAKDERTQREKAAPIQETESNKSPQTTIGIQTKQDATIQKSGENATVASTQTENKINNMRSSGGAPLDNSTRDFMESRMGHDFSEVRVHTGPDAESTSKELNAKAYTIGKDIAFNKGEYRPETKAGKELIAHELTHTIQQGGVKRKANNEPLLKKASIQRKMAFSKTKPRLMRKPWDIWSATEIIDDKGQTFKKIGWKKYKCVKNCVEKYEVITILRGNRLRQRVKHQNGTWETKIFKMRRGDLVEDRVMHPGSNKVIVFKNKKGEITYTIRDKKNYVKIIDSEVPANRKQWTSMQGPTDWRDKEHYPGKKKGKKRDNKYKVDLGRKYSPNRFWYGPNAKFRVEKVEIGRAGWGSLIRISILNPNGSVRGKVNMIHFTEISREIYDGEGKEFPAGTFLGTTNRQIGLTDGPHLHMEGLGDGTRDEMWLWFRGEY